MELKKHNSEDSKVMKYRVKSLLSNVESLLALIEKNELKNAIEKLDNIAQFTQETKEFIQDIYVTKGTNND